MSTTFQLSTKPSDHRDEPSILLIRVDAPDDVAPEAAWGVFVRAATEAGLQAELDRFDPVQRAQAVAASGLGATPVQQQPANVTAGPWGQPQAPPQLPAAAQSPHGVTASGAPQPPGPAPFCPHGQREFIYGITKSGKNAGLPWKAWACPADRNDPSKCEKDWIRD